jgi:hypothetical protein
MVQMVTTICGNLSQAGYSFDIDDVAVGETLIVWTTGPSAFEGETRSRTNSATRLRREAIPGGHCGSPQRSPCGLAVLPMVKRYVISAPMRWATLRDSTKGCP